MLPVSFSLRIESGKTAVFIEMCLRCADALRLCTFVSCYETRCLLVDFANGRLELPEIGSIEWVFAPAALHDQINVIEGGLFGFGAERWRTRFNGSVFD